MNKFDSDRKRQSIIIENGDGSVRLLCKVRSHACDGTGEPERHCCRAALCKRALHLETVFHTTCHVTCISHVHFCLLLWSLCNCLQQGADSSMLGPEQAVNASDPAIVAMHVSVQPSSPCTLADLRVLW
jgi:hypothetical protein